MSAQKLGMLAFLTVLLTATTARSQVAYTITDLGLLPGFQWDDGGASGINNFGQVSGNNGGSLPGVPSSRGWRYTPGSGLVDMGSLNGPNGVSIATGINSLGQVIGISSRPLAPSVAFRYTDGVGLVSLGTLPGPTTSSASGINSSGQVVGTSGDGSSSGLRAFRYSDGIGMQSLPLPVGATGSSASAINDAGQIVIRAGGHLFRYSDSAGLLDLGSLGGSFPFGNALNNSGAVVGSAGTTGGVDHAFKYSDSVGMFDLGVLSGGSSSSAEAIDSFGNVVGTADSSAGILRAFLYRDGFGMTDLNTLIDPLSGWTLLRANGINDLGQIVGEGTRGSATRAFLLTPVPEPSSIVFVTIVCVAGLRSKTRLCQTKGTGNSP